MWPRLFFLPFVFILLTQPSTSSSPADGRPDLQKKKKKKKKEKLPFDDF
jgi:hypothetical protein